MASKDSADLFAIAVLIDELKHDEASRRLESMRQLKVIAEALGPDRTRNELIPFLSDSLDDEDEVLLVMAEQLGDFVKEIGGPGHAKSLLAPLESLSTVEEATVRDKAVAGMAAVAQDMSDAELKDHFLPLIRTLTSRDWFTARISACALFAPVYSRVPAALQTELRSLFASLCKDDTPMVRRAAAQNLGPFAAVVASEVARTELVPLFVALAEDDQDSVRLLAVQGMVPLSKVVGPETTKEKLVPVVLTLAQDKSWRVRWSIASSFESILAGLGANRAVEPDELVGSYLALARDLEAEVRAATAGNVAATCKSLSASTVCSQVVPLIGNLASDASDQVREALASSVMGVAPIIGKEKTSDLLLSIFLQLLKDDNAQVKLAIISGLSDSLGVVGIDELSSSLLPAIVELSSDRNWRVRARIVDHISILAKQLEVSYFDKNLVELCLSWLNDKVHAIRQAAAQNLLKLLNVYGKEWAQSKIVPRVVELKSNPHYLYRLTSLYSAELLVGSIEDDVSDTVLVPLVVSLSSDPVPNVRFNVAKSLTRMRTANGAVNKQRLIAAPGVKTCLAQLMTDSDIDVKYYSSKAMTTVYSA